MHCYFVSADRKGVQDIDKVHLLHNHYLDVLAYEIQRCHADTHSRTLIDIFRLLPMLGPMNYQQTQIIGGFLADAPAGISIVLYSRDRYMSGLI